MTCAGVGAFGYHPVTEITQHTYTTRSQRYGDFSGKPFSPPVSFGTAAVSMGAMTCAGVGAHGYHPVVKITQFQFGTSGQRYGPFDAKGFSLNTGAGSATIGHMTCAGSATFAAPVYHGSAAVSIKGITASAAATFAPGTHTATAAVTIRRMTASGTATRIAPLRTASAAVFLRGIVGIGNATFHETDPNTATGNAFITIGAMTASGEAIAFHPASMVTIEFSGALSDEIEFVGALSDEIQWVGILPEAIEFAGSING